LVNWRFASCVLFCLSVTKLLGIEASVIIASINGEVSSFSIEDEFSITLDSSSVGKKLEEKSILVTGKNGNACLLFSNGALITIESGSRFYLRRFEQKNFTVDHNANPSQIEVEPSQSQLLAHLDFGNLIVKAPKLNKGSSMVLSSPLGTAGIRGTMFQLVAVRNPVTGDITGGVNLISGDISFTDVGGNEISLVSGQSLQLASGKLGESMATVPGGLVNLSAKYGDSLTAGAMPPSMDMLFPDLSDRSDKASNSGSIIASGRSISMDADWEMVHEIASEIFFTIESSEQSSSGFTFDDVSDAVLVSTPSSQSQMPLAPNSVTGGILETIELLDEVYLQPPLISLYEGGNKISKDQLIIEYRVKNKYALYPTPDFGPFKILPEKSSIYPSYNAKAMGDLNITPGVKLFNIESVKYSEVGQESKITLYVDDFDGRKINYPTGEPVSYTINPVVRIVDDQRPLVVVKTGYNKSSPLIVKGKIGDLFDDPGVELLDNYYSQEEIENYMGYSNGAHEGVFGFVNMEVAGLYEIIYQEIYDPSGNVNVPASRWVMVEDDEFPEIFLYGSNPIYVDLNSSNVFKDPGAFALDNLDGEIEWESGRFKVFVEMLIDENLQSYSSLTSSLKDIIEIAKAQDSVNATFRLKYEVQDNAGNISQIYRQVTLLNSPFKFPTITLNGDSPHYHEVNTDFLDEGVFARKKMGSGVNDIDLTNQVSFQVFQGGSPIDTLDATLVNYDFKNQFYVDEVGNEDPTKETFIRYEVIDQFGNTAFVDREVRVVDTTPPNIVPLTDASSTTYPLQNLEAGYPFVDSGAYATDNYDSNITVTTSILKDGDPLLDPDPSSGPIELVLSQIGFWEPGNYEILYEATDENGNSAQKTRDILVRDTIAPHIAIISHPFIKGEGSLNSISPSQEPNKLIIDSSFPMPTAISNQIGLISGYDALGKSFNRVNPYINEFGSDKDFYIKHSQILNFDESLTIDDPASGKYTEVILDKYGRSLIWHSAFTITLSSNGNNIVLRDPGVYVRNDTSTSIEIESVITKTLDLNNNNPLKYFVSYNAEQSTGEYTSTPTDQRRMLRFLDEEAPSIDLSPETDGINKFVMIEAGTDYGDTEDSAYRWVSGQKSNDTPDLNISVWDAFEGSISQRIVRTIYSGIGIGSPVPGGQINGYIPETNTAKSNTEISNEVIGKIKTDKSYLNQFWTIKYDASDSFENHADPKYRYLIVKDTLPPVVNLPPTQLVLLDYTNVSGAVDVRSEASVKEYLLSDMTAVDANGVDDNFTWSVTITKPSPLVGGFDEPSVGAPTGIVFPTDKDLQGYIVEIIATDSSGNPSEKRTRELKIGDFTPPVITIMGKTEIHDYLRYKSNSNISTQLAFADQPGSQEYNGTGYTFGDHRKLLADYNFVDPGVYAEDSNAHWSKDNNYVDWDGDGVGEIYNFVNVSKSEMEKCEINSVPTPHVILVSSTFSSTTLSTLQQQLGGGDGNGSGFRSSSKIPLTNKKDPVDGYNYNASSKDSNSSKLQNLNVTKITIQYRVMDGWGNKSNVENRDVYIYESQQYENYAFFATPIQGLEGNLTGNMESFYNNGSGNSYLTSLRKDFDGDGMSDYWEAVFGTDPKVNDPTHSNPNWDELKSLNVEVLKDRVRTLNDFELIDNMNSEWISNSHFLFQLTGS
jgi:hypothetical protein